MRYALTFVLSLLASSAFAETEFERDHRYHGLSKTWYVGQVLVNVGDGVTTKIGFDRGLTEANPLLGKRPSMKTVIGVKVVTTAISVGGTYLLDRVLQKPKAAKWWAGATIGYNGAVTVHNARLIARQR
jgi:hypothetical protein